MGEVPCVAHLSPEKRRERWGWRGGRRMWTRWRRRRKACVCGGDDGRESVPLHAHYHLFIWKTSLHRSTAGSLGHAGSRVPVCVCVRMCAYMPMCGCLNVCELYVCLPLCFPPNSNKINGSIITHIYIQPLLFASFTHAA